MGLRRARPSGFEPTMLAGRRCDGRALQLALGSLWILDGILQAQPVQFGSGLTSAIEENAMGEPGWVHAVVFWLAGEIGGGTVGFDLALSLGEIALGIAIVWPRTRRPALMASIAVALAIWVFGEAFGGLASGFAVLPAGSPGAGLLYALAATLLLPRRSADRAAAPERAASTLPFVGHVGVAWTVLWLLAAVLQAIPTFPNSFRLGAIWQMQSLGEPGFLGASDRAIARLASGHGLVLTVALVAFELVVALAGVVAGEWRRRLLVVAIVGCAVFWVLGENLGELATGGANDPGAMPLYVLLALVLYGHGASAGAAAEHAPPATVSEKRELSLGRDMA